jgi:glycosyltransferase involved in cell wall biosynthesis
MIGALNANFDFRVYTPDRKNIKIKLVKKILEIIDLHGYEKKADVYILDYWGTVALLFKKKTGRIITLIHHIDNTGRFLGKLNWIIEQIFYYNLRKKVNTLVVVSKYWQDHFIKRQFNDIRVIHNPFNVPEIQKKDVEEFKKKYNLEGKPIIYVGNCQKIKGADLVYQELKLLDAYLVTSGKKKLAIPTVHLELDQQEYFTLLKAADLVITMSIFKEGWCRTAHEALLMGTPVIGSGKGGMGELLNNSSQILCENINDIKLIVQELLAKNIKKQKIPYVFSERFSIADFNKKWVSLINEEL